MSKLEKIEEKERRDNMAFINWIGKDGEFHNLNNAQRIMLTDYVVGLHREIADWEVLCEALYDNLKRGD